MLEIYKYNIHIVSKTYNFHEAMKYDYIIYIDDYHVA